MELGHLFGEGHRPFNRFPQRRPVRVSTQIELRRAAARKTIEDIRLAQELGIHYDDLKAKQ